MSFRFMATGFHFLLVIGLATGYGFGFQPEFTQPINNLTVSLARNATFRCSVHHLGGYRVGWVKADTKAIQAIHDHVITHNPRISVSHTDHSTWNLHIRNVQEEDRGQYMCQINTDPMKSQLGYLNVVVPPDFIDEETSSDVDVPEGGTVKLTCRARGHPDPRMYWRREDGAEIVIREPSGQKTKVASYQGDIMRLVKVSRSDMGVYMCIATNGIPPSISKRIIVNVNFRPVIQVPNQLVGAPLGTDVALECITEAFPEAVSYWMKDPNEMVVTSSKYNVQTNVKSVSEIQMITTVRNLQKNDLGTYRCIAKNSLGEVESNIRIYEIPGPTKIAGPSDEDDYNNEHLGSTEVARTGNRKKVPMKGRIVRINTRSPPRAVHENYVPVDPASNNCKFYLKGSISRELLLLFIALSQIVYLFETW